jgi:DNA repair protein RecO (recombination protein O)
MNNDAITGWLLHKRVVGDTSIYATFFTKERGLLHARVQGGRTRKKQAILQLFVPLWLVLDEKKYGMYVRNLELSALLLSLTGDRALAGLYVNELLYRLLRPHEQELLLFQVYEETLHALSSAPTPHDVERALRQFEWMLLQTSGLQVSYELEADGVSRITTDDYYTFQPNDGFTLASKGFKGEHILAIGEARFDSTAVLKAAKIMMRQSIDALLEGKELYSRTLYRQVLKERMT